VWLLVAAGISYLLWTLISRISNRNLPVSTITPNQTQVYRTIAAMLTDQGNSQPSTTAWTVTPSPTTRLTQTPFKSPPSTMANSTPRTTSLANTPAALCDLASAGSPLDITIPDDSLIAPGQSFIKTWRLVNSGICTWTAEYSVSFFYGDRMGAPELAGLDGTVLPGQNVEISIEMVAPRSSGTYQGNWMLSNPAGALFGIGPKGDSPFWVRIKVVGERTSTPTATEGPSATFAPTEVITATSTPLGELKGTLSPAPGDSIDLDTIRLNTDGEDLTYQLEENNYHWLIPHDEAIIGVYGSEEPAQAGCQGASMSSAPIAVESLAVGTYLCYTTGEGRLGRMLLEAVNQDNFTLTLDLLTWLERP